MGKHRNSYVFSPFDDLTEIFHSKDEQVVNFLLTHAVSFGKDLCVMPGISFLFQLVLLILGFYGSGYLFKAAVCYVMTEKHLAVLRRTVDGAVDDKKTF